jgi:hypothetical protein
VVHQPGDVHPPAFGFRQHAQDPPVQLAAAKRGQRAIHRLPQQLVAEPDRVLAHDQQPGRDAALHRRRPRSQGLLQQPQLGPGRDHGDQPHHLLGVRRQAGQASQYQVADGHGNAGVAGGQHLGDQQRVPAGEGAQPGGRAAGPPGQLRHRRLGQRLQLHALHHPLGQGAQDPAQRVVGAHLVVPVGHDQHRRGTLQATPQEHQQVKGRLVGPVHVLHHDHPPPRRLRERIQERGEDGLPRPPRAEQGGQPATRLPGDVVQRPQRPGRQQRVTGPQQEPDIRRTLLGEPPDQGRLADAGLARHQDDTAARRRRGQHAAQLLQQRRALEQVHHNAALRKRPPQGRVRPGLP